MVTALDVYKEIRRLQLEGATSQRQVARQLGISRNTVKKYWNGESVPWEKKEYTRATTILTEDVLRFIGRCLDEDDAEHVKKQHHTARRIYHRLVEEQGFTGSESSIRNAVHELRIERKSSEVFVPLSFQPGDSIQIDWGEATVYMNGSKTTVNLFCARMCYSCAPFVIAYWRQNLESFLDALIRTFKYFGGVTRNVIFDNARVAVKSGFGAHAAAQDDYSQLAAHYGFQPVFCNPASGNEKGLVENLVGYIRRNVCVPLPHVTSLEELNGNLLEQCVKYLGHKVESRPQPVGQMLEAEQHDLRPLPKYQMDISRKGYPVVGRYSTVLFDTNHYSVPCKYRGKHTTLKAFPNTVEVWINGELVAVHDRCLGKKQESLDLQHYLPILAQKGRAIRYARPVLNAVPMEFIDWMENQHLKSKEMVEVLEQCLSEGYKAVMQRRVIVIPPSEIMDEVGVQAVDLSQYDHLCGKEVAAS